MKGKSRFCCLYERLIKIAWAKLFINPDELKFVFWLQLSCYVAQSEDATNHLNSLPPRPMRGENPKHLPTGNSDFKRTISNIIQNPVEGPLNKSCILQGFTVVWFRPGVEWQLFHCQSLKCPALCAASEWTGRSPFFVILTRHSN